MKFKQFLFETPIIYDPEDKKQVLGNIDKRTNTIWIKHPPVNANLKQIENWVDYNIEIGGLKDKELGQGITKIVYFNDDKTVFKYNYDNTNGNQITNEIKIYQKFYNQYSNILPKFYDYGKNWCIQEYIKPLTIKIFELITKISINDWNDFRLYFYDLQIFNNTLPFNNIFDNKILLNVFDKKNGDFNYFKKLIPKILKNKNLIDIIKFCYEAQIDIKDIGLNNLGIDNNNIIKIIDFGLTL